ncbi:MAG: response regulator transcription factor [Aquificae bacterium]|nr:response regulator transcription factor [Aquificota bacterium]
MEALKELKKNPPDLILLDIMLPDIDGLEFCKIVKSDKEISDIPIIMLTAKSTEIDKIVGLELGADDYVTKPFSFKELIARIRAVLRRTQRKTTSEDNKDITIKDLRIKPEEFKVLIEDKEISLTSKEFRLLLLFVKSPEKVFSREEILNKVWEREYDVYDRTVDVHIKHLREKLKEYGKCIKTVRGVGYKWECEKN